MFDAGIYIEHHFELKEAINMFLPVAEQCGINFEKTREDTEHKMYFEDFPDGTCLAAYKNGSETLVLESAGVANTELYVEHKIGRGIMGQLVCYGNETGESVFIKREDSKGQTIKIEKYNYDTMCIAERVTGKPLSKKTLFFTLGINGILPDETISAESIEEAINFLLEIQKKYSSPQIKNK